MLEALRRGASGWVAKIFMGLLVLSFAVWGVADIFRGYRGTDVAEVGDTPITVDDFRRALQQEIQRVSRQVGTYLTMDQARSLGIDGRVLGQMMAEAALNDEANTLGLGLTDAVVAESIRNDDAFKTPGGQFDKSYFEQVLRSSGYTEAGYVYQTRKALVRQMIADAVGSGVGAPLVLEKAVDRYRNEARQAEYIVVTTDMVGPIAEPTEEQLRTFYDENKADFRAPEYRKIAVLTISPAALANDIEVSDEETKASYDADPDRFGTPERRTIERIVFEDVAAAEQARKEIEEGKSFEDVAAGLGLTDDDRKLGTLTKDGILDPAVGDAAFALQIGDVSQPVQGTFGPALVRVTEILPGMNRTLDDVRDEIRLDLATQKAKDQILDMYDAIEDDRAGGMTLAEIGQKRGLPFREIEAIDDKGLAPDESTVADLPESPQFLSEAFAMEIGVEADPLQTRGDGWAWFDVEDITPSRELSFEEAREKVATAWRAEETAKLIEAKAKELADRIRGGTGFFAAAEELGTTSGLVGPIRRTQTDGAFGGPAVQLMFTTAKDDVASTAAAVSPQRVVFRVTDITVPEFKPGEANEYKAEIETGISNDLLGQYLRELEARIGTAVNQEVLRMALGESDQ